jgi:hypothetical protein
MLQARENWHGMLFPNLECINLHQFRGRDYTA